MEKVQFLERILGSGTKANRDYYQFHCPFCNHPKRKLGVSLDTGKWKCWVCPSKGLTVYNLLYKLGQSKQQIELSHQLWPYQNKVQITPTNIVKTPQLPLEYKHIWKQHSNNNLRLKALDYLLSERGLTYADVMKHLVGFCDSGSYNNMVIFPSYQSDNLQLNYYSARTFTNSFYKFKDPVDLPKTVILDDWLINWNEPVILTESRLDAIAIKRNAIPLNGKGICNNLRLKILESNTNKLIYALDGDALDDAKLNSEYFLKNGIEIYITEFPENEDPNSLGFDLVWEYIDSAKQFTMDDLFKFKITKRLKSPYNNTLNLEL